MTDSTPSSSVIPVPSEPEVHQFIQRVNRLLPARALIRPLQINRLSRRGGTEVVYRIGAHHLLRLAVYRSDPRWHWCATVSKAAVDGRGPLILRASQAEQAAAAILQEIGRIAKVAAVPRNVRARCLQ